MVAWEGVLCEALAYPCDQGGSERAEEREDEERQSRESKNPIAAAHYYGLGRAQEASEGFHCRLVQRACPRRSRSGSAATTTWWTERSCCVASSVAASRTSTSYTRRRSEGIRASRRYMGDGCGRPGVQGDPESAGEDVSRERCVSRAQRVRGRTPVDAARSRFGSWEGEEFNQEAAAKT